MQLIFETEATVNIVEKMTSLDAMAIAETKPDSPSEVIKESKKCNPIEMNTIDVNTAKPDENRTSKEQNGDVDVAMVTDSDETVDDVVVNKNKETDISAQNHVVNKNYENDISSQNGNSDIVATAEIDTVEPVSTKDTKITQIVSDSINLMQVEVKHPEIPENLEIANSLLNPEDKIKNTEFASNIIKQDVVQENSNVTETTIDKTDLDITKIFSHQPEKQNENTDVQIKELEVEKMFCVPKNGDACEAKIDNLISVLDSKSDDKELTVSNNEVETNTPNATSKEKLEPKNSIDDDLGTTDCTEMEFNAVNHYAGDKVTLLGNNFQERTKTTDETQDTKTKSRDEDLEIQLAEEAQENKIKVTDDDLKHKKETVDLEEGIKSTKNTQENTMDVSYSDEGEKSTSEAEANKMDVTHQKKRNNSSGKSIDRPQETNATATDCDKERKPSNQEHNMQVTYNENGIKSTDRGQENNVDAAGHEEKIKSTDEVLENKIKSTDHKDGVKLNDDAEIKTIDEIQENKMQVTDCVEEIKSCDDKWIHQHNSSEEKCRQDSLEIEPRKVDENNKEIVKNVNSDNLGSNSCGKSILNSGKQEKSVKGHEENQIKGSDDQNIGNNVNKETQLQNIVVSDNDKKNDSEIKDISESRIVSPKEVKGKDFKAATTTEAMDVDSTDDLTTDDLTVPSKAITPIETISDDIISVDSSKTVNNDTDRKSSPVTIIDCDEIQETSNKQSYPHQNKTANEQAQQMENEPRKNNNVCGLSNTLDILSDDDDCVEECKDKLPGKTESTANENKCINLDEDDDVMLIDDPPINKEPEVPKIDDYMMQPPESETIKQKKEDNKHNNDQINTINLDNDSEPETSKTSTNDDVCKDKVADITLDEDSKAPEIGDKPEGPIVSPKEIQRPIIPENFLKAFRKNVVDMNRDELEEFCLMKIVEGIIDQTNLSEIKTKLKTMNSYVDEWKKKVMALTKQNRDLQIVLKTVQDEQKKRSEHQVVPLKITRSVGMQVYMAEVIDRNTAKRKTPQAAPVARNNRNTPSRPSVKPNSAAMPIPVPRLVPAPNNSPMKARLPPQVQNATVTSNSPKQYTQNGMKTPSPAQKSEKRPFSSVQSVTVDLTDDEPPTKQPATVRNNAQQAPVRLVAQQQLMKPRAQIPMGNTAARKVFIPINPQNNIRPGQTITLKSVPNARIRGPGPQNQAVPIRIQSNALRGPRPNSNVRHPAPLPEVAKQQQPPNWKALPPAPDLKISKVENGIVISWKIEGYQEDSYEEIASYQLYAYQETSSPPSTLLWKKIGDVKALPLPMACTLTQFMAGYKYYFAVRAVDIRSRIGAFSLPGSILLLNK